MSFEQVLFYLFAALALGSALGMLFNVRNTVAAAMCLVVTMVSLAGVYVLTLPPAAVAHPTRKEA